MKTEPDTIIKKKLTFSSCCGCVHSNCNIHSIDVSHNDNYIAYHKKEQGMVVENATTGEAVLIDKYNALGGEFVKFNESGTLLISISGNGIATVRNTDTWKKVLSLGEKNAGIRSIHSDYSGNTIVTVGTNGITKIYNGKTGIFEKELSQNIHIKDEDFDRIRHCFTEEKREGFSFY